MPALFNKPKLKKTPQKILVMRYRFIGDTLLTIPFLRNLRAAFPDAQIDMLVGANSGELLTHCPYIDNLIYFDTTRKHRYENSDDKNKKPKSFWSYMGLLRQKQYDTAFVLKRSFSSAALAFLAGIPQRIGFNTEWRSVLLTHPVPYQNGQHEIECFLDTLRAVNIPVSDTHLEYWPDKDAEQKADEWIKPYQHKQNILIHFTSSNPLKQWPKSHYTEFTRWLSKQQNILLHAVGAKSDKALYDELAENIEGTELINWCGQTSLTESMALISHMTMAVGVDSGTLHMAAAANVPVLALFGPMDEQRWQPVNATVVTEPVACRPCNLKVPCHYNTRCMTELSVEKVQAACQSLLTQKQILTP